MFKFIHAADIHLDSPLLKLDAYEGAPVGEIRGATRRAFENLVQTAVDEKVAFVLIAGDLYDGDWKDYNTGLYFTTQMGKLREAGIPVIVAAGNHDAESSITKSLRLPENVRLFPADQPGTIRLEGLDVAVHGQSFESPTVTTDLSRRYPAAVPGCFNIGLLHTCVNGREGHAPYAPCTLEALRDKGYDYWALGHVHRREVLLENPWVVFAGNTQGRHARETGPKGCLLVSVSGSARLSLDFRPLDVVRWEVVGIDAVGAERGYDVVDRFRRELSALLARNPNVLSVARVVVDGETNVHDELLADPERWANEIRSVAVDEGGDRVWVEKVKLRTRPPAATVLKPDGAVGELLRLMDELTADPEALRGLGAELSDLEKKLPREFRQGTEGWRPDEPGWLAGLLSEVRPMLVQRLLRKKADE
ncbi:MAG TPA: DNA repair exonuclease [Desulfobacterales bacterium]|nr:DNA repair exonuclease [Desulfobacterales bacterium]